MALSNLEAGNNDPNLGPILFLLYTADLLRLVEKYSLRPHLYADDMQIYGSCHPTDTAQLQLQMSACIDDVATWMCSNRLQLNTAKTEVIWCTSSRRQHQLPQTALRVGNSSVMPSTSVRDLGIYIDSDASLRTMSPKPCLHASPYCVRSVVYVGRSPSRFYDCLLYTSPSPRD